MKIMVYSKHMKIKKDISVSSLLKKLRSGYQMLAHINWVSAYGSHISVASVLGVVGLFLAVRDGKMANFSNVLLLPPRNCSSQRLYFVPGLRNLGNNCFLNVVLQSLASCSSFRSFLEDVQNSQASFRVEHEEDLPLLVFLAALLEELSTLHEEKRVLNPRIVMTEMQQYIPQFQLSNQQDAAEALLHLISCLRDELSESYLPKYSSLADVASPASRIIVLEKLADVNEPERWRQQYLGPFNGILSSFLTCQSCSSEILMDFSFFHTLSLSPISYSDAPALGRFTLEDCIKSFLAPEHLENYSCNRCWHIAANRYLSSFGRQEDISKLNCCSEEDSCGCRNISSLRTLPWSNCYSRAFKKLSISHCPQIFCFHLQRSSMNVFGELVKIQGHISFPMDLNLSPFVKFEVGIHKQERNKPMGVKEHSYLTSTSHKSDDIHSNITVIDATQLPEPSSSLTETCSSTKFKHSDFKVTSDPPPSKNILYRLVSVVEHFGRSGSGHYTVYRGVKTQMAESDGVKEIDTSLQWFRISDSEVHYASIEDVLTAEATLLFYERI